MIPQTRARLEDPITSHEAAEAVDPNRSQLLVLDKARELGEFTDLQLVAAFRQWPPAGKRLSESRIRSARHELVEMGRIEMIGYTAPARGRRRCIWRALSGASGETA